MTGFVRHPTNGCKSVNRTIVLARGPSDTSDLGLARARAGPISANTKTPDAFRRFCAVLCDFGLVLQPDDHALKIARVEGRALGAIGADDYRVGMAEAA